MLVCAISVTLAYKESKLCCINWEGIMRRFIVLLPLFLLSACAQVGDHRKALDDSSEQKLTLGVAQREIREGMSQADVAKALGSPNMVTKDKDGVETWIYDKVSTDFAYSTSSGGVSGLIFGLGGGVLGGAGASSKHSSGASSRTQRTLTIIIKFANGSVKEFTYNATSFYGFTMKNLVLALVVLLAISGCESIPKSTKSPLELQSIQSKEFETSKKIAFAAVLSVFQDVGYTVSSANLDTGLITAKSPTKQGFQLFVGQTMEDIKATAFIEEIVANRTKVRVNLVSSKETSSGYGMKGGYELPIESPEMYQDVFAKIQQGIFVRKNTQ